MKKKASFQKFSRFSQRSKRGQLGSREPGAGSRGAAATRSLLPILAILVFLLISNLPAQDLPAPPDDGIVCKIAVIGPGDELYFWWGHLGLIIENTYSGEADFVDYGVFSFANEDFIKTFAFGKLLYTTTVTPAKRVINHYISTNRDVTLYTLNLTHAEKQKLIAFTQYNLLPENRDYLYNHFSRNCVTPVTDTLDAALDGAFYALAASQPGKFTLRQEIRRFMSGHILADLLLNFWMGNVIDKKISVKEELFLPEEVGRFLEDNNFAAQKEEVYKAAGRSPISEAPRSIFPQSLIAGILIALFLWRLSGAGSREPGVGKSNPRSPFPVPRSMLYCLFSAVFALVLGVIGSLLFFMTFWTAHDYTYHNINVIFANPIVLAGVPFSLLCMAGKKERRVFYRRAARFVWAYVFIFACIALILNIIPAFRQDNRAQLAIILPISFILAQDGRWRRQLKN